MVTLVCDCTIKEDKLAIVKPFYQEVVDYTRKQPGCIYYDVYQDRAKPTSIVFIERWSTDEDLNVHLNDKVFLDMYKKVEDCFAADELTKAYDLYIRENTKNI